ncbi:MAG: hypothetical protein A07HB70_01300 [uncultured archaeon A07HB70]|nr:MAG: hypothetical protein A07HB70_01300 [uncultured archaeon A07HB70]
MELEEGMLRKVGLSVTVVLVFIAAFVGIGLQFSNDGLSPTGGLALVAGVVLFILSFAAVGLLLND